jgi:hypothetical protein
MALIRSLHIPQLVQARVALATAASVAAPSSIAEPTSSLVTARQMHANTSGGFLSLGTSMVRLT